LIALPLFDCAATEARMHSIVASKLCASNVWRVLIPGELV
jgi:hypothetical protein